MSLYDDAFKTKADTIAARAVLRSALANKGVETPEDATLAELADAFNQGGLTQQAVNETLSGHNDDTGAHQAMTGFITGIAGSQANNVMGGHNSMDGNPHANVITALADNPTATEPAFPNLATSTKKQQDFAQWVRDSIKWVKAQYQKKQQPHKAKYVTFQGSSGLFTEATFLFVQDGFREFFLAPWLPSALDVQTYDNEGIAIGESVRFYAMTDVQKGGVAFRLAGQYHVCDVPANSIVVLTLTKVKNNSNYYVENPDNLVPLGFVNQSLPEFVPTITIVERSY